MTLSTPPVLIRPMRVEDVSQVIAIDHASFSLPWPESAFLYEIKQNPSSQSWVAEVTLDPPANSQPASKIAGMVVTWFILDEAHIATLAVHPGYRRLGIGRKLLVTALQAAIRKGMVQATLEVRASNWAAQELYRAYKFEEVGRRKKYYKDNNEDALIMTLGNLGEEYAAWLAHETTSTEAGGH